MVNLDENVTYLIGRNGSGKTKLGLDLIWFVLQGIAEKSSEGKIPLLGERFRFIGKDGATAMGELVLHDDAINADIRVIRKLGKNFTNGDKVEHINFGKGRVLKVEGEGDSARIHIFFDDGKTRKFLLKFTELKRV
jgi:energy-coupling factor transporter ATP-binding protein EcfA2